PRDSRGRSRLRGRQHQRQGDDERRSGLHRPRRGHRRARGRAARESGMSVNATAELPFAYGGPPLRGTLRSSPEDFLVDEDLGFAPDGAGEHVFVRIEKRGANTDWVARELARFAGVGADAVSYAGLKDRHAVARQTFSIHLPGRPDLDWSAL